MNNPSHIGPRARALALMLWGAAKALMTLAARAVQCLQRRAHATLELGQYTLEEKIGEGAMGIVYKARHPLLRRPTAIKLLPPHRAGRQDAQRFEREVQLTSSLTHPNTIAIYDYGRTRAGTFYAMEYVEGITLEELIASEGAQPAARVAHILRQVCGALEEAHRIGLVHRDIKPANIMLCERGGSADHVKVLDFGLVKEFARDDASVTRAGALIGTPSYLAPEAISDPDRVDPRSDLYALGAVGYQLLTGLPVFDGANLIEVCAAHLYQTPQAPSQRAKRAIPASLEALVLRCLNKAPEARPASATEVLRWLDEQHDVPAWSAADARTWWDRHAAQVTRSEASRSTLSESGTRSVPGDLVADLARAA